MSLVGGYAQIQICLISFDYEQSMSIRKKLNYSKLHATIVTKLILEGKERETSDSSIFHKEGSKGEW